MKKSNIWDKKKIRYDQLKTGDIVICGGMGIIPWLIRLVTKGVKDRHNAKISTHTGILTNINGQYLIAEMRSTGLEINSLEEYNSGNRKRFIIDIRRSNKVTPEIAKLIDEQIALDRRHTIEYDYKGDIAFVFKKVKASNSKDFCSEYVARILNNLAGVKWGMIHEKISPYYIQRHTTGLNWMSVYWYLLNN